MTQQDNTWREMIREGIFRTHHSGPTELRSHGLETDPFSEIWPSHLRRPTQSARSRLRPRPRARPRTASAGLNIDTSLGRGFRFANTTGSGLGTTPVTAAQTWLSDWANPVPIIATSAQIRDAIEELDFSSIEQPLNDRCPISQQPFSPTDRVARIRRCGHICEAGALRRWFTYSVRCPVCRIDIRDESTSQPTPAPPPNVTDTPTDNTTAIPPPPPPALPPPPLQAPNADFSSFATRIATELASQILGHESGGTGNLTVEYALVGPNMLTTPPTTAAAAAPEPQTASPPGSDDNDGSSTV